MNKLIGPIIVLAVLGAGIWYVARPQTRTLGETAPEATDAQTLFLPINHITGDMVGQSVGIEGTIKTMCPTTGCWAVIADATGEIRIDTRAGGFNLPLNKEGAKIKVTGVVQLNASGSPMLSAQSAEVR